MQNINKKPFQIEQVPQIMMKNPQSTEINIGKQDHNSISKFEKLQPEIIFLISEFLTYDQYLQLRLINHYMNRRIQYISVLKVYSIKSQIQYFQSELEERRRNENYEQNIKEFGHFDYQIQKLICRLDLANLLEVRAYCNPPLIVLYIFEYLMILLNIKPKDPKDVFKSIKVMLSNPVELVCRLEQMKISDIKQSQLQKLTPILQIPVELAQNLARASGIICEIIQLIVKAHNSCQFTIQLFMIEEKITKNIYKLGHLNKIFGLNNN